MKSKQLISKVSMLTLVGVTVLGASSSVFAKPHNRPVNNRPTITKPGSTNNGCSNNAGSGNNNDSDDSTEEGNNGSDSNTETEGNNGSDNNTGTEDNSGSSNNTEESVSTQTTFENKVLELVNVERAKNNLAPLTMDESVRKVARIKSSDMSTNKYFSHTSPTYGSPFAMLKQYGISYKAAAENIAQGYTSPEAVVKGWMNSSGHRANILNASYTKIGIGYEANGHYWTQMFIG